MNKLMMWVLLGSMAGAASAAILVDEAFNYPDGPLADVEVHTGAGLTGMYSNGGAGWYDVIGTIEGGGVTGQGGPAFVSMLNPVDHAVGDNSVVWMSYRYLQNGRSGTGGVMGFHIGPNTYQGISLGISDPADGTWSKGVMSFNFGQTKTTGTNVVFDSTTVEG